VSDVAEETSTEADGPGGDGGVGGVGGVGGGPGSTQRPISITTTGAGTTGREVGLEITEITRLETAGDNP